MKRALERAFRRLLAGALVLALPTLPACAKKDYAAAIETNWGIRLPEGCEEIYKKQSEPAFNGDSERYHVFDCGEAEGMPDLVAWYDGLVTDDASYRLLDELGVTKEDYPQPGKYKKYTCKKTNGSTLVMLYSPDTKLLYVLEDFY